MSVINGQIGGDHYKKLGEYQPWVVCEKWMTSDELRGLAKGTAIWYLCREGDKGGREDIKKALHTLQLYLEVSGDRPVVCTSEIQRLQNETSQWSDSVFGEGRFPLSPLHHLLKEVAEVIENPADDVEYADCLLLLIDAYRMRGGTADELVAEAFRKLEINRERKWGEPDHNGVVEHVRSEHEHNDIPPVVPPEPKCDCGGRPYGRHLHWCAAANVVW